MLSARESLERLREGNKAFASSMRTGEALNTRGADLPRIQDPFAVILGCSDARVPTEIIFNQGLGDLFVIRVAGNIVGPSEVGSIEFAVAHFNAQLIVVLGHTQCGGILATLGEIQRPSDNLSPNLRSIVDRVRPSVEALLKTEMRNDMETLVHHAVRANVLVSVNHLRHGSGLIESAIQSKGLAVVGAEYSLESGEVDFFETAGAD